jgi:alpha-1,6-mannosyltransferase
MVTIETPAMSASTTDRRLLAAWIAVSCGLVGCAGALVVFRHRFDWALQLRDIPALPLAFGLVVAGLIYLAVLPLVSRTADRPVGVQRLALGLVVGVGLALRLLMLPTEPALEDDQQRYLWEGALVAHGMSPYALAPSDAWIAPPGSPLARLSQAAGPVFERINHPNLKTIYPPVAQASFALAYLVEPFSLTAWRLVLLAADGATLLLLVALLDAVARPRLWAALYWLNPIVVKEVFNSAHMEGVLTPLVLAAVLLVHRRRPLLATGMLGLAAGVKIWPVLLWPLLIRPTLARPRIAIASLALLTALLALWATPILIGGIDQRSGFLAYASRWQANSALLPALRDSIAWVFSGLGATPDLAGRVARGLLALTAAATAVVLARQPIAGTADLLHRIATLTLVLVLVSPAQFPWYAIWALPFVAFTPRLGVVGMAVTMPIYYASFHMSALGLYDLYRDYGVWVLWVPIWLLLARDFWCERDRSPPTARSVTASEEARR